MINAENFTNEQFFNVIIRISPLPPESNLDFVYKAYCTSINQICNFINSNESSRSANVMFNPVAVFNYIASEYIYNFAGMPSEEAVKLSSNENLLRQLVSVAVDKYLTLEYFSYLVPRTNNKYYPPLTSLDLYVTKLQHLLDGMPKNKIPETLMNDMYGKFFSMCKCVVELITNNHETEALSTWRTIHETECIITVLNKYPETVPAYLKHIKYNLAYRNSIADKEEQDSIFIELKSEMKELGLKSKDMKRYIENGWIYAAKEIKEDPNVKLNFRMGIEYAAGLEDMNDWYEVSSEIAHGSPLLIYSNKGFFLNMTVVGLLKSFLRVEEYFASIFVLTCQDKDVLEAFTRNRSIRLEQIRRISEVEEKKFDSQAEYVLKQLGLDDRELDENDEK